VVSLTSQSNKTQNRYCWNRGHYGQGGGKGKASRESDAKQMSCPLPAIRDKYTEYAKTFNDPDDPKILILLILLDKL
jgi:hypothetical protein